MARLPRIVVPNQPLHIMHRGNNRQDIFETDEDMMRIKEDLAISLSKSACQLLTRPTKLTSHGGDRKSGEYKNQAG